MTEQTHREEDLKSMSLGDHLEELRVRMILTLAGLFLGLVVCLFFGKHLIRVLEIPYHKAIGTHSRVDVPDSDAADTVQKEINETDRFRPAGLQTKKPAEGFITYIKICLVFGLLLTSPWVFWQRATEFPRRFFPVAEQILSDFFRHVNEKYKSYNR